MYVSESRGRVQIHVVDVALRTDDRETETCSQDSANAQRLRLLRAARRDGPSNRAPNGVGDDIACLMAEPPHQDENPHNQEEEDHVACPPAALSRRHRVHTLEGPAEYSRCLCKRIVL